MRKNRGFTPILILVIILVVAGALLLEKNKLNSVVQREITVPNATTASILKEKCNGIYKDAIFNFSIDCPSSLSVYTYRNDYNQMEKQEKILFFCDSDLKPDETHGYYLCKGGGIMVWANGDGWGGGCDSKNHSTIELDGETESYCLYPGRGFGQLYIGDDHYGNDVDRYLLEGSFSKSFTQDNALHMLSTFKFTN